MTISDELFSGPNSESKQPYVINQGTAQQRAAIADWLFGLDAVSPETRERIVTAWLTSFSSSRFKRIDEAPFYPRVPGYLLRDHVNDVTRCGLHFAALAAKSWGDEFDQEVLVSTLITHDLDKPLLYTKTGNDEGFTDLSKEIPHGVIGGMILKELDFPHEVVAAVTTHAGNMPFHSESFASYVLHYADFFSADHVTRKFGKKPFYQHRFEI